MAEITLERAQAAKGTALRRFGELKLVVGVGITRVGGDYAVKINMSGPPGPDVEIPADIDGVPVRIEIIGSIRKR
jgi:hypothetical protein